MITGSDHVEMIGELCWRVDDGLVSLIGPSFPDVRGSVACIVDRDGALSVPRAKRKLRNATLLAMLVCTRWRVHGQRACGDDR